MEETQDTLYGDDSIVTGDVRKRLDKSSYDVDFTAKVVAEYLREHSPQNSDLAHWIEHYFNQSTITLQGIRVLKSLDPHLQGGEPDPRELTKRIVDTFSKPWQIDESNVDPFDEVGKVKSSLKKFVLTQTTDQKYLIDELDSLKETNISVGEWSVLRDINGAARDHLEKGRANTWLSDLHVLLTLTKTRREDDSIY